MNVDLVLFNWGFVNDLPYPVWLSEIKRGIRPSSRLPSRQIFIPMGPEEWARRSNVFHYLRENAVWVALPHCTVTQYFTWCEESWFGKQ